MHECPNCGSEVACTIGRPQYKRRCSFCRQPFTNLVEHYDSCEEIAKVREIVRKK